MKKYWRWIVLAIVIIILVCAWILLGANSNLRKRIEALILERKVKTEIQNLRDRATKAKTEAETDKNKAVEAERIMKETDTAISKQKEELQKGLEKKGMSSNEIADRFRSLSI